MSFGNPIWLLLLAIVPLTVLAAYWARARSRRYAVRFTAMPALRAAAEADRSWTRWLPAGLLLAAIAALALTVAKPQVTEAVPIKKATIVLVTDHSGSMQATDVSPTRLGAAQRAANTFVDKLPRQTLLGVVAYSSSPDTVQPPSTDHEAVRRVIADQQASGGTATGNALQTALDLARSQKGGPAAVVLLSDGATTVGSSPVGVAAQTGQKKKIPVYTVALGTSDATIPDPTNPYGPPLTVPPDPETLRQIARVSGGHAFSAQSDEQLSSIYQGLGSRLGHTERTHQVTAAFAIAALFLLAGAGVASVTTRGRAV